MISSLEGVSPFKRLYRSHSASFWHCDFLVRFVFLSAAAAAAFLFLALAVDDFCDLDVAVCYPLLFDRFKAPPEPPATPAVDESCRLTYALAAALASRLRCYYCETVVITERRLGLAKLAVAMLLMLSFFTETS